jgi:hypothetical protein
VPKKRNSISTERDAMAEDNRTLLLIGQVTTELTQLSTSVPNELLHNALSKLDIIAKRIHLDYADAQALEDENDTLRSVNRTLQSRTLDPSYLERLEEQLAACRTGEKEKKAGWEEEKYKRVRAEAECSRFKGQIRDLQQALELERAKSRSFMDEADLAMEKLSADVESSKKQITKSDEDKSNLRWHIWEGQRYARTVEDEKRYLERRLEEMEADFRRESEEKEALERKRTQEVARLKEKIRVLEAENGKWTAY